MNQEPMRCDDCGTALGEIQIRVSDNLPVCVDCFVATQPKQDTPLSPKREFQPTRNTELQDAAYWRGMYQVMFRILCEQHEDPALHWLDEIVHTRFSKLL